MPQKQRAIDLILRDGQHRPAIATGNNAAWKCECGRALPLLGCSGALAGVSLRTRVDCPDCPRSYFVVPTGKNRGAVLKLERLHEESDAGTPDAEPRGVGGARGFVTTDFADLFIRAHPWHPWSICMRSVTAGGRCESADFGRRFLS